jgi:hypothetical protein
MQSRHSDESSPGNLIPPDEAEHVQRLVRLEVSNVLALHKSEIDLQYRVRRYKELHERYRALRSEEAEVKRQMEALGLPPLLLRKLKSGLDDAE